MINAIVLIIANEKGTRSYYDGLMDQWERYMNTNSKIKCFFITLTPKIENEFEFKGNTLYIKGDKEEYVPQIFEKTIKSIDIVLKIFKDVKHIVRTNISAFWIWDRLLTYLETAPTTNFIASGHRMERYNIVFPWGSNMLFSRDVAEIFSKQYNHPEKTKYPDDVMLGLICKEYTINLSIYPFVCTSQIVDPELYQPCINNIKDDVIVIRNNILDPKIRVKNEGKKYEMLVNHFYSGLL